MDSVKYRDSRNHQCHCMSFITFFFMSTTCSPSCINIYIQANNNSNYTVRFLENENAPHGHNYGFINFQLSSAKEGEKLAIVPTFTLLNRKANLPEDIPNWYFVFSHNLFGYVENTHYICGMKDKHNKQRELIISF